MLSRNYIEKELTKTLKIGLSTKGLVLNDFGSFDGKIDEGFINFTFVIHEYFSKFILVYGLSVRFDYVEEPWEKYRNFLDLSDQLPSITIGVNRADIDPKLDIHNEIPLAKGGGIIIETKKDIDSVNRLILEEYKNLLLPFIKGIDIKWLDEHANPTIQAGPSHVKFIFNEGFWFKRLVIAKLSGNPEYPQILKWIQDKFQKGYESTGNEKYSKFLTVIERIDQDVNTGD